jgi:gamma-glutamylcyclotransferase (GGCT)/AIG2-like uncharacterized protein YtfP
MMESMMPHSNGAARHVFVYGTLRRGGRNDIAHFRPAPVHVGDATIAGTLYDLGSYPGVVLKGAGCVIGEIYRITPPLEAQLDRLEEVQPDGSGEYRKREVDVTLGSQVLACLVYEIHPDRIAGRPVIVGGDWMAPR